MGSYVQNITLKCQVQKNVEKETSKVKVKLIVLWFYLWMMGMFMPFVNLLWC